MPLAPRPLIAVVGPAAAIAFAWSSLESPARPGSFALAAAAGVVPALLRGPWLRAVVACATALVVVGLAFDAWPRAALGDVWRSLHDAATVSSPFPPGDHPGLHGLVVSTAFVFATLVGVAVVVRAPLVGAGLTIAAVGWPAAILADDSAVPLGCAALAAALWIPLTLGARTVRASVPGVVIVGVLVAASAGLASAGASPGAAQVHWRGWDPFGRDRGRVGVAYVWNADYGGIRFPSRATVVLHVKAPRRALYWRASTLDLFVDDRWIESLYPIAVTEPRRRLPEDPLLPRAAANPRTWLKQQISVEALDDERLVAASQPTRVDAPGLDRIFFLSGGVMFAPSGGAGGQRYTVWSYAPRPTARALTASPPRYPAAAQRYLELGRARVPAFGATGRGAIVGRLFTDDRYQPFWPYEPLWREAQRLSRRAGSPYEATLAIERWLRSDGGFVYDELPPRPVSLPPLVDFVTRTRLGYCQQYAGTMALMLRVLGIPSRVAVGFTSGHWKAGVWTVTDRDAHAWVEAWFAGYGWLTFDPTPGRGTLSLDYTLASDSADAVRALGTGRFLDFNPPPTEPVPVQATKPSASATTSVPWWLPAIGIAALFSLLLVPGVKRARSFARLRTNDPRRVATAVRDELVDTLRDHGVAVDGRAGLEVLRLAAERSLGFSAASLTEAVATARYGPPEAAGAAAVDARLELRRLLRAVRRRLGAGRRVRAALAVRSLRRA